MESAGRGNDVSLLFVGHVTVVTDVTRVVMPDVAAMSTARVVGRKGGADVCHWLFDIKSRIGCGPQCEISVPELLFPVIWTCCAGHWITQGSMLAGGHRRGCWCRWPVTLGTLEHISSMASMVLLNVDLRLRQVRPILSSCLASRSRCSLFVSSMLRCVCSVSKVSWGGGILCQRELRTRISFRLWYLCL